MNIKYIKMLTFETSGKRINDSINGVRVFGHSGREKKIICATSVVTRERELTARSHSLTSHTKMSDHTRSWLG